jgi:signal transduction histidine kinase
VWLRDAAQRLVWVNTAYANAVEADEPAAAVSGNIDLVDSDGRRVLDGRLTRTSIARERLAVVSAGERRILDVVEVASDHGTGGIGVDVTELEKIHGALKRTIESHARTLDQLATAVAIFGPDRRLAFYNAAYQALWGLDAALLEGRPEDGALLDALRAARKLPEQADFRAWKRELLATYQSVEAREHWWHLPDGQTLRVLANPHPQGGVTYVYENVTERLDLESRYNALIRVQGETLDHLAEGVAVFGSDGRLRLWNPAFEAIWRLDGAPLAARPHVNELVGAAAALDSGGEAWRSIAGAVTGLTDGRTNIAGRVERRDGTVIDYATVPLPDGGTLATFVNITDTVKVERALVERNEALIEADRLKDAFIQHVSYELRSPLTTIIGFAELVSDPMIGALNDKQREYTDYILSSSKALLAIINDILDLATIDAGVMDLELAEVAVADTIAAAIEGVKDRLRETRLTLDTRIQEDVGSFVGDEKRVRQVLFNLVANAIAYSEPGGRVEVACALDGDFVRIAVSDHGPGIPARLVDQVFDRFVSDPNAGGERRGAGLGLSIVKSFVELHGGAVAIDSKEGVGTTVVCRFPRRPTATTLAQGAGRRRAAQ